MQLIPKDIFIGKYFRENNFHFFLIFFDFYGKTLKNIFSFFRGRETKSILIKRDEREKIPRPVKEGERLLQDSRYND